MTSLFCGGHRPQATAGHHCNQTHPPPPYRRIVPGTRQKGSNEYLRHLRPRVWPISKSIFLRCWGHAGTWSESSPSLVEVHHHYLFSFLYFNYLLLQERVVTSPLLDKTLAHTTPSISNNPLIDPSVSWPKSPLPHISSPSSHLLLFQLTPHFTFQNLITMFL